MFDKELAFKALSALNTRKIRPKSWNRNTHWLIAHPPFFFPGTFEEATCWPKESQLQQKNCKHRTSKSVFCYNGCQTTQTVWQLATWMKEFMAISRECTIFRIQSSPLTTAAVITNARLQRTNDAWPWWHALRQFHFCFRYSELAWGNNSHPAFLQANKLAERILEGQNMSHTWISAAPVQAHSCSALQFGQGWKK